MSTKITLEDVMKSFEEVCQQKGLWIFVVNKTRSGYREVVLFGPSDHKDKVRNHIQSLIADKHELISIGFFENKDFFNPLLDLVRANNFVTRLAFVMGKVLNV